jgi:hypothetical protein
VASTGDATHVPSEYNIIQHCGSIYLHRYPLPHHGFYLAVPLRAVAEEEQILDAVPEIKIKGREVR